LLEKKDRKLETRDGKKDDQADDDDAVVAVVVLEIDRGTE
jgi:hypothetical protein